MTEARPELTTARVSGGGIPPRLVALVALVALAGVVFVGIAGQSTRPPAAVVPGTIAPEIATEASPDATTPPSPGTTSPQPTVTPGADDVLPWSPDGLDTWEQRIGLELTIGGMHYPGRLFASGVDRLVASYSVAERIMNQSANLSLTGYAQGAPARLAARDRWLFSLPPTTQDRPQVLLQKSVLGRSANASAPAIMQVGYDIKVHLAAPAHGRRALTIELVPNPAVQARTYRYSIATTIVGGTLRVPLAPEDGNTYRGAFELDVADVIDREIDIQAGRGWSQSGLEVVEQFGFWEIKLKALRGSHGNPVSLVVAHAPPNDMQGLAPDDMERVGYTVAVTGRRDGDRLYFGVELVIGGLVAPAFGGV